MTLCVSCVSPLTLLHGILELECWTCLLDCRIEIVMLMSKENLNFNNKMETKCSSSHLYVFELVLPLLFKGVCVKKG